MSSFTRRTHIVRIFQDPAVTSGSTGPYIDVEVLDAIAFREANGKEVILSLAATNSDPLIVDNTGAGNDRQPDSKATSRSHMRRITSTDDPAQQLDVEVIDVMAFRDANGAEWILDMQPNSADADATPVFDTTGDTGGTDATRRVHDEVITDPLGTKDPAPGTYLTSQRCDAIAFRSLLGREVILSCPSNDDPNSSDARASTFLTPQGYDPTDDTTDAIVPPGLTDSGDKRNYVAFVDGATDFKTDAAKIAMGPFWWVRKFSGLSTWLLLNGSTSATGVGVAPSGSANISLSNGLILSLASGETALSADFDNDHILTSDDLRKTRFSVDSKPVRSFVVGGNIPVGGGNVASATATVFLNVADLAGLKTGIASASADTASTIAIVQQGITNIKVGDRVGDDLQFGGGINTDPAHLIVTGTFTFDF